MTCIIREYKEYCGLHKAYQVLRHIRICTCVCTCVYLMVFSPQHRYTTVYVLENSAAPSEIYSLLSIASISMLLIVTRLIHNHLHPISPSFGLLCTVPCNHVQLTNTVLANYGDTYMYMYGYTTASICTFMTL